MTPSDEMRGLIERVEGELKPEHRKALCGEAARTDEGIELRAHLHPARRCSLQRQGLLVDRMYSQILTPLGLAVRSNLLERQADA